MTFDEFHNGLRILMSIDSDELDKAGVFDRKSGAADLNLFYDNPHRWFILASNDKAMRVWELMKKRMKP